MSVQKSGVFLLLGFFIFNISAQGATRVEINEKSFQKEISRAKAFEDAKQFKEAVDVYQKLRAQCRFDYSQGLRFRKSFEALNIKMIFSNAPMDEAIVYEVKEGDHLSKIAQEHKTTVELLKKSNGIKDGNEISKGLKLKVIKGVFKVKVDKSDNVLELYLNKRLLKQYRVTTGARNKTPVGTFKIINKIKNPTWYWEDQVIPAESKENLLGTRWLGFDKEGFGIHGTVEPEAIGRQASLGCVRMLNKDVEELYAMLPLKTQVAIQN